MRGCAQVQLVGSPIYVVEQRLGKGGFGQVCRGTRLVPRKVAVLAKPNQARPCPRCGRSLCPRPPRAPQPPAVQPAQTLQAERPRAPAEEKGCDCKRERRRRRQRGAGRAAAALSAGGAAAQVAIKFEHHSSKGCPGGGPPNEWAVYQALGETHGIPKLYFKGSAADFYIMVRRAPRGRPRVPRMRPRPALGSGRPRPRATLLRRWWWYLRVSTYPKPVPLPTCR